VVTGFFPQQVQVHVGDTVTWQLNTDEFHTVSFLNGAPLPLFLVPIPAGPEGAVMLNPQVAFPTRAPGAPVESFDGTAVVSSGLMAPVPLAPDAPANTAFSLVFTEPGSYSYVDLGLGATGTVEVLPATASVPSQAELDAQAQAELAPLLAQVEAARAQSEFVRSKPGLNGSTIWFVKAGAVDIDTANPNAQAFDFLPKELSIKAGDSVVWSSPLIHTITFVPVPPIPEAFLPQAQEAGPPILAANPMVFVPAEPAPIYDPAQYFNSGPIGPLSPGGLAWILTFDEPGVYEYVCALHHAAGMKGTITVLPNDD
jgi:plastocyanin